MSSLPFVDEEEVHPGVVVGLSPLVRRVVANNPGPYTLHGTCTYMIGRGGDIAVVDPGPDDEAHINALMSGLDPGERITAIFVTHTHTDHSPGTRTLRERTGAVTYGFGQPTRLADPDTSRVAWNDLDLDPSQPLPRRGGDLEFEPDVTVHDGDVVEVDGWSIEVIHTPGHATNHVCYHLREEASLCTGDHVMGWATTVISPPDGNLGEFLASLRLLRRRPHRRHLPGHGPPIEAPHALLEAFIAHRESRSEQILEILAKGPATIADLVPEIYGPERKQVWPAAGAIVHAHLLHLHEIGRVQTEDGGLPTRAGRFTAETARDHPSPVNPISADLV